MEWKTQSVILLAELVSGFVFGRVFIPYFRKIKTGKFDFYIGDRFAQDSSEPKFGGVVLFLTLVIGIGFGLIGFSSSGNSAAIDYRVVLCTIMYIFILLCTGLYEDYQKETKRGIGMKPLYKWGIEYFASVGFLVLVDLFGYGAEDVLMPFRLGDIHFGVLYIPLMALFMTLVINCAEIHDCTKGAVKTGCDGLCTLTSLIIAIGISCGFSLGNISGTARLFAVCMIGATAGFLFWNLSPSKIYNGQSGSIMLGGLFVVICILSGLHLLMLFSGIAFIVDGVCALLQRIIFVRNKKLLFKGASLHEHFMNKGFGEYKIMCVAAGISVLGAAASVAFIMYAANLVI